MRTIRKVAATLGPMGAILLGGPPVAAQAVALGDGPSIRRRSMSIVAAAAALMVVAALAAPTGAAASSGAIASGTTVSGKVAPFAADGRQVDAAALAGMSDCPLSWFCVWNNTNFSDGPGKWQNNEWRYTNWRHDSCPNKSWNDCASSLYNHGQSCKVTFYENIDFGPGAFFYQLPRGSYLANLALDKWSDGTSPNNKISSHQWFC